MNKADTGGARQQWAYLRVSDKKQHIARQVRAVQKYTGGLPEDHIFKEKMSGRVFDRPEYMKLKAVVRPGDELILPELDRAGRDYEALKQEWAWFERNGVHVTYLDDASTYPAAQPKNMRPMEKALRDCNRSLRSAQAEEEWVMRKNRQAGGIAAAKERGVYAGANHKGRRRKTVDPELFERLYREYEVKPVSLKYVAEELGVSVSKACRMFKERRQLGEQYHPNKINGLYDAHRTPADAG